MKTKSNKLLLMMLGIIGPASGQVVYEDSFDEDGLTTNNGTGGGGIVETFNNASGSFAWNDDDDDNEGLSSGVATSGGQITTFRSENSFNVSNGFTLEVTFDMASNLPGNPYPSNHFSFGMVSDELDTKNNLFATSGETPLSDGIGFSLGLRNGSADEGLIEWDLDAVSGEASLLNAITFATGSAQTLVLDVGPDGSYTYTYGAISGSGTTVIDLTQTYFFKARTQGSQDNVIQSVTLTTNSTQFDAPTITTAAAVYDLSVPVDFNITFDASATTATLDTPANSAVDLLALDTDNDGIVVFTEAPPMDLSTYTVTASRSGIPAPLSESTEVTVIDPAEEAADNAFSLAIKADSPLFYYRYEEETGTTFLRDSSGNGFHTNDFSESLTFGTSPAPGGMQNAADFSPSSGARYILSPATSEMSASFSFVSVLNVSGTVPNANTRNLLSMTNGTGSGASIFGKHQRFRTFIDGTLDNLTEIDAFPSDTSCLVHYVFTADEVNGGGEAAIYIDGELYGTPVTVGTVGPNVGNWVIGATQILGDPSWLDWLDETAVFEEALTPTQIETHATAFIAGADPLLGFNADAETITLGESVTLSWKIGDSATGVSLYDGTETTTMTETSVTLSPTSTTTYELNVTGPGGPFIKSVTVIVDSPPGPIEITDWSADPGALGIDFTIEIMASPETLYEIYFSEDLVTFETTSITIFTAPDGTGSATVPGIGNLAEYYRVESAN
ncbi:LamG-like jellyroll fold domain-containing protein [Roseibacillus persicicus]|uniref:LamG-like jellyroll fold domain-containing protein n=1 Tax=Roseibacillus persicicus TaxID=454148 RepID=UPI00398B46E7